MSVSTRVRLLTEIAGVGEGLGFGLDVGAGVGGVGVGVGGVGVGDAVGRGVGAGVGSGEGVDAGVGVAVGSGVGVAVARCLLRTLNLVLCVRSICGVSGDSAVDAATIVIRCGPLEAVEESQKMLYGGPEARYLLSRKTDTFLKRGPTLSLI